MGHRYFTLRNLLLKFLTNVGHSKECQVKFSIIRICTGILAAFVAVPVLAGPFFSSGQLPAMGNMSRAEGRHFTFDIDFSLWWAPGEPASQRFADLAGYVEASYLGPVTPYLFHDVRLTSRDGSRTFGSYSDAAGAERVDFSFTQLTEGVDYRLTFVGEALSRPTGDAGAGWMLREWGYATKVIASPTPEPSSLILSGVGLAAVAALARRHRQRRVGHARTGLHASAPGRMHWTCS